MVARDIANSTSLIAKPWWRDPDEDCHSNVFAAASFIRKQSSNRRREDIHHMDLYGNRDIDGSGYVRSGLAVAAQRGREIGRQRYNLCSSMVDTAESLIAQQKPKPMYLTSEGDFRQQRQARLRSRVLEGQLDDSGAYQRGPEAFKDGGVVGTGITYAYPDEDGHPQCERVLPLELLVDHAEGLNRRPRSIYRQKLVAREVLMDMYGDEHARQIKEAKGPDAIAADEFWVQRDSLADQVVVIEAWHLRSGPDADDGRHVVCIDNATLVDEEFNRKSFPFAVYRWKNRMMGYWGVGIVEECRDAQWRINRLIKRGERMNDLGSNLWVFVNKKAKVDVNQIRNQPAALVMHSGEPPQVVTTNGVPQDITAEIARIREEKQSELGISGMVAEGKKPAGLNSGAAQRAHDDIHSRRHIMPAKAYEQYYMDLCRIFEEINEEQSETGEKRPELAARVTRGRSTLVRMVKWGDVQLPENKYRMRVFPTSALPSTPQGKWATVQEWIASGFIDRPQAQQLLDFPDLDANTRLELADLDKVMSDVEMMLDDYGDPQPSPFQDLEFARETVRKSILAAETSGAPDSVLDRMTDYIADIDDLMQQAQEEAAAQQPAPPAEPQLPPDAQGAPPPEIGMVPGGMG